MLKLVIANKNYSSWSLRPWLLLRHFHLPFREHWVSLKQENLGEVLAGFSGSKKVPVLQDEQVTVWDSLAICEYLNDVYLENNAWPNERPARAHARAIACEMHSGFEALRREMPMDIRAQRDISPSDACQRDIARIDTIWDECLKEYSGPWLFERYSIADCMFAPVVLRMQTYGIALSTRAQRYCDNVLGDAHLQQWIKEAKAERETLQV